MNVSKFNNEYLRDILTKIKNEYKDAIFMGDFNVNLIDYNKNKGTHEFLEQLFNHNFTPQIPIPTRFSEKTATLANDQEQIYDFGNIITSISTNLPQFIITENSKEDNPANKTTRATYRDYKRFDMDSFKKELQGIDWTFATHNNNVNQGFETILWMLNITLDKHAPKK